MFALTQIELCKAFRNRWLLIALCIGLALAFASAAHAMYISWAHDRLMAEYGYGVGLEATRYVGFSIYSSFSNWMLVNANATFAGTAFFYVAPLLCCLPFACSLAAEEANGYTNHICTRAPKGTYYVAKSVATFVSGGAVIALPLVVNFLAVSCYFPAYLPLYQDVMYIGVFDVDLWSWLFYNIPVAYIAAWIAWDFVIFGCWALFVQTVAAVLNNRVVAILLPYLLALFLSFINRSWGSWLGAEELTEMRTPGFELFDAVHAIPAAVYTYLPLFGLLLALIVAGSLLSLHRRSQKDTL